MSTRARTNCSEKLRYLQGKLNGMVDIRPNETRGFAVVDVETTGLNPMKDRIVEVGVVLVDTDGHVTGDFSSLVNPQMPMRATFVHGIRDEDVRCAPVMADIVPDLMSFFEGRAIVAHNARFDMGFLNMAFANAGYSVKIPATATVCTMELSKIYLPPGRHSLVATAGRAGIEVTNHHRALADAYTAAGLLREYIEREKRGERYLDCALSRAGDNVLPASWELSLNESIRIQWPSKPSPQDGAQGTLF